MKTKASILVVDDEPDLPENIGLALEAEGYRTLTACDGVEALDVLQSQPVDLVLADVAMPGMNGYQLYERVRENPQWVTIPFIFLSARKLNSDIRYGKELGADDYLTKPIRAGDLLAVVRGKLRRAEQLAQSSAQAAPPPTLGQRALVVGRLTIDPGQHRVWMDERAIKLSAREFKLLEYLARQAGQLVSLQELIRVTHGLDTDHVEAGALLRPLIRSLRRKLGYGVGEMGCIENVRGVGYRLTTPGDS
jgi:DNA-binding response OmpR family regulator